MAFKILDTFLVESMKLAVQKQFFMDDLSSPTTQSRMQDIITQIPSVQSNLRLSTLKIISSLILGFFTIAMLTFSSPTIAETILPNTKIAIVDVQFVLDSSIAVKHLRESIDKISEQFSKELSAKEIEFKEMEASLVRKRESLKAEKFDTEVEGFYKKLSAFQHDTQKKKEKLERAHSEAIEFVHENTIKIVHEISKEKGFNLALPMSQTLYSDEALNITSEVIKRLNHRITEVQLKY